MQARAVRLCGVCGGHEIACDEVLDGGLLHVAACVRCGHLWTERPLLRALRPVGFAEGEVVEAA